MPSAKQTLDEVLHSHNKWFNQARDLLREVQKQLHVYRHVLTATASPHLTQLELVFRQFDELTCEIPDVDLDLAKTYEAQLNQHKMDFAAKLSEYVMQQLTLETTRPAKNTPKKASEPMPPSAPAPAPTPSISHLPMSPPTLIGAVPHNLEPFTIMEDDIEMEEEQQLPLEDSPSPSGRKRKEPAITFTELDAKRARKNTQRYGKLVPTADVIPRGPKQARKLSKFKKTASAITPALDPLESPTAGELLQQFTSTHEDLISSPFLDRFRHATADAQHRIRREKD